MRGDPEFQIVHRRIGIAFLPMGMRVLLSSPELMLFFNHAGGVMVLAALLKAAMARPSGAPVALAYSDIGDRFGVSRTHVRQLLEKAQSAGLVRLSARGGRSVEILPPMWSSYDRALAGGMYIHDIVHLATLRQIGAGCHKGLEHGAAPHRPMSVARAGP